MENDTGQCPFLKVPAEIRLMIYDLLLDDGGNKTLSFRSEPPDLYKTRSKHRRTSYFILGPGIQRRACQTTYVLCTSGTDFHTNILAVNHKIHEEASWLLYGQHAFEFASATESVVPFLSDLRAPTRRHIQALSLTKMPAVYSRDFDRSEWSNVCGFLAHCMRLRKLTLRVVGGQPLRDWSPTSYSAAEFKTLARAGYDSLGWVQELMAIKGLEELEIVPDVQLCPPPNSMAMEFFAAFSASIEKGFAEFLRSEMLPARLPAWQGQLALQC